MARRDQGEEAALVKNAEVIAATLIAMGREMQAKLVELGGSKALPEARRHECFVREAGNVSNGEGWPDRRLMSDVLV